MKRFILVLIVIFLASIQPVFGQTPSSAQIVFRSWDDGDADIYLIDADGQNLQNLTDNTFTDVHPSWSADGNQILFVSNRDDSEDDIYLDYAVYTMDATGQNVRLVADNVNYEVEPSWSPDGSLIAVVADEGKEQGHEEMTCVLSVMKSDGSEHKELFSAPQCDYYAAVWSPDSTHVLVDANESIYSIRVADGAAIQLTLGNLTSSSGDWSPDGSKIVYVVDQHDSSENYEVYSMNADGSNQKRLTNNPLADVGPRFTNEGSAIVFDSGDESGGDLYSLNLVTNEVQQLTDSKKQKFWWTLAPDGNRVIYTEHTKTDEDQIYVLDLDAKTAKPLSDKIFRDPGSYSWRPVGGATP